MRYINGQMIISVVACVFPAALGYGGAFSPTPVPACSFNSAPLTCASGTVLGSVLVAEVGSFTPAADCDPSSPWDPLLPACPLANVAAQVFLIYVLGLELKTVLDLTKF